MPVIIWPISKGCPMALINRAIAAAMAIIKLNPGKIESILVFGLQFIVYQ
jgi:hypothetical protein